MSTIFTRTILVLIILCLAFSAVAQHTDCFETARILKRKGQYLACIQLIDSCILGEPNAARLYNLKANAILSSGSINEEVHDKQAIKLFSKAIALDSTDARYFNNRGWAYQFLDFYKKASKDFDKAVELSPNRVAYHHNTLRILWIGRKYKAAMRLCDKLIARFPDDGYAYHVRGNLKRDYLHKYLEGNKDIKKSKELGWGGGILLEY